jgi:hypothetical protein
LVPVGREQVRATDPQTPVATLPFLGQFDECNLAGRIFVDQTDGHIVSLPHDLQEAERHPQVLASPLEVFNRDGSLAVAHAGAHLVTKESRHEFFLA